MATPDFNHLNDIYTDSKEGLQNKIDNICNQYGIDNPEVFLFFKERIANIMQTNPEAVDVIIPNIKRMDMQLAQNKIKGQRQFRSIFLSTNNNLDELKKSA